MDEVRAFLSTLGTPAAASTSAALVARGAAGATALTEALAAHAPLGAEGANGRAVFEDLEAHLSTVAHTHPEVLVDAVSRHPALIKGFAFVSALTRAASPAATELLVPLLHARDGSIRWLVLGALLQRKEPRAIRILGSALSDRDGLVVFKAATALREHGTDADLPRLVELARSPKTAPGTRDAAFDAIEAICARSGLTPPIDAPPPRLVTVNLLEGAEVVVSCAQLVATGDVLAETPLATIHAPCDAVVVDADAHAIVLRRR